MTKETETRKKALPVRKLESVKASAAVPCGPSPV